MSFDLFHLMDELIVRVLQLVSMLVDVPLYFARRLFPWYLALQITLLALTVAGAAIYYFAMGR